MLINERKGNYLKTILFLLLVIPFGAPFAAQDKKDASQTKPDLTGTWDLDQSRSMNSQGSRARGLVRLTISHKEPEIKFMRRGNTDGKEFNNDSVFYTDNRGETNPSIFQMSLGLGGPSAKSDELKSKTKWDGNKLVSHSSIRYVVSGYSVMLNVIEKRELSSDGKTLTITISFNPPEGSGGMTKEVFTRAP